MDVTPSSGHGAVRVVTLFPLARGTAPSPVHGGPADRWSAVSDSVTAVDAAALVPALRRQPDATAACYRITVGDHPVALVVDVQGLADDLESVILAAKDLFDPDVPLRHGDGDLFAANEVAAAPKTESYPHQIVLLPPASRTLHSASLDGAALDFDDALRQLMFKDTDIRYDPAGAPVATPADTAAGRPMRLAVWDTMTVVEGLGTVRDAAFAEGRLRQLVDVNAQVLAARTDAAGVRTELLRTIQAQADSDAANPSEGMAQRLAKLRELRRRLVHDVSVLLSGLAVQGGRPVVSYHRSLVSETGIQDEVAATDALLSDLVRISELDQQTGLLKESHAQARRQTDLLDTSRAIRLLGTVFATVSLTLGAAGVVAALAAVPAGRNTWAAGVPRSAVWGSGITLTALLLGVGLALLAPLDPTRRSRRAATAAATTAAGGAVVAALVLWRAEGTSVTRIAFAGFVAALLVVAAAVTAAVDFERKAPARRATA